MKTHSPDHIATWRFEMIAPLLDASLSAAQRAALHLQRASQLVSWPSGDERVITRSTLYRWVHAYRAKGYPGLLPKTRADRGKSRARESDRSPWIERAIQLLLERPDRSLTLLSSLLEADFPKLSLSRSTLHRELHRHPSFHLVELNRKRERKLRRRFQSLAPHNIWQLDAKGSFEVRFRDGTRRRYVILTVLDDHSRAVLAVILARSESLVAAVRVFRRAANRYGLPGKIYADRHSVYDSLTFRTALAMLGIHRIRSRAGNAPARGKIEAYHRIIVSWFIKELPHQIVIDERHLEDLLQACIDRIYQKHRHRGLKTSPEQMLAGRSSQRLVTQEELTRAFLIEKTLKAHAKTGEVEVAGTLFRVPRAYAGQRVRLRYDPVRPESIVLIAASGKTIPLSLAIHETPLARPAIESPARGAGSLQRLLDVWRGRELPQAPAGFGLPEVFQALASALSRRVPATEREASAVMEFYRQHGPFATDAFVGALSRTITALGTDRPITTLIDYLSRLISSPQPPENLS